MKITQEQVSSFQKKIFSWWKNHKRDLPWRHTHNPYHIMVSEVMLQQTQVLRVIAKYREFIERYPTVFALAKASTADVLKAWKGMGYNRRALYLKAAAQAVVDRYGGTFPKSEKELVKLPGLGTYTARAILVFAYRQNVACVDTNIRQIITHFFFHDTLQNPSVIQDIADQLVPKGKAWEWHQALMDYAALRLRNKQINKYTNKQIKKISFRDSNRFYRGRIIDRLRESSGSEPSLIKEFQARYGKPAEFMRSILAGLVQDGLIVLRNGTVSLPE